MLRTFLSLSIVTAAIVAPLSGHAASRAFKGLDGFIVVNPDGTEARGSAGFSSLHYRTGEYEIDTTQEIHSCAYSVSQGTGDSTTPAVGYAVAMGRAEETRVIMVATYDANDQLTDRGFHLIVRC